MYSPGEKIIRFMKGPNFKNMILNIGKGMNMQSLTKLSFGFWRIASFD